MKNFKKYSPFVYFMGGVDGGSEKAPEAGDEVPKKETDVTPDNAKEEAKNVTGGALAGLEEAEELGSKKRIDKEKITTHPELDSDSAMYKKLLPTMKAKLEAFIKKRSARKPQHRDTFGTQIDGHSVIILMDESGDPPYRLFRDPKETEEAGQESQEDDKLKEATKGLKETNPVDQELVDWAKDEWNRQHNENFPKGGILKTSNPDNGAREVVYRDKNKGKFHTYR